MKIAIIDDERPAREELKLLLSECAPDATLFTGSSGEEALILLDQEDIDVLFLDIQLNDINGTVLVSMIRRGYPNISIVFATAYEEYAAKAFDLNVTDYITKPFHKERLLQTLQKINKEQSHLQERALLVTRGLPATKISIQSDKKIVVLDVKEIIFIETNRKNLIIHTIHGDYSDSTSLNSYEERLKPFSFYRTQKSYLINLNYLDEIVPWFNNNHGAKLKCTNGEILPIGRNQLKELRSMFRLS